MKLYSVFHPISLIIFLGEVLIPKLVNAVVTNADASEWLMKDGF